MCVYEERGLLFLSHCKIRILCQWRSHTFLPFSVVLIVITVVCCSYFQVRWMDRLVFNLWALISDSFTLTYSYYCALCLPSFLLMLICSYLYLFLNYVFWPIRLRSNNPNYFRTFLEFDSETLDIFYTTEIIYLSAPCFVFYIHTCLYGKTINQWVTYES